MMSGVTLLSTWKMVLNAGSPGGETTVRSALKASPKPFVVVSVPMSAKVPLVVVGVSPVPEQSVTPR